MIMIKKIGIIVVVLLVVIQLIPNDLPEVITENPNDLISTNEIPKEVSQIIKTSCYDCHSNETVYPWYSYVAPVSFLVGDHVVEGREELNFSEWNTMTTKRKLHKLEEIGEEVEEGEMPMIMYPITHPEASLSESDRELLINWAKEFAETLIE